MATESFSLFDLAPGRVFAERFRIEKVHRHNGLAPAFLAEDQKSGELICLTVFSPSTFESTAQAEEFRVSCQAWTRVKSPHVAKVREIVALPSAGIAWVSEVPHGEALKRFTEEKKRMEIARALKVGLALLDGLAAIHHVGLVHGDIKPSTVYVDGKAKKLGVELVDGGITPGLWNAKHLGERTALIGTPFYAPVEQFGGESPDVQSDVYNVAAVLFELITGVLPWPGKSYLEIFQAKLDRHAPSMQKRAPDLELPSGLEGAIAGGLVADRRERYPSVAEFRAALERVVAE
ncbi:MAG: serine/threonine protein kinase [Planctomycetes bacterium]|nr:serine/threonine protein kinase [Planctomycetota bacterium]